MEVIKVNERELSKILRTENQVYQTIMGALRRTSVQGLGAEIGASLCTFRDIQNKIIYTNHALNNDNKLVKGTFFDVFHNYKRPDVVHQIKMYMKKVYINLEEIGIYSVNKIKGHNKTMGHKRMENRYKRKINTDDILKIQTRHKRSNMV